MKAKRVWIRQHPAEPSNVEVTLTRPDDEYDMMQSMFESGEPAFVHWKEWVAIPVEDDDE